MRSVHSNEKPFECEYCKMKFARSETLSKHRLRKHGQKKKGTMVENFFLSVYYHPVLGQENHRHFLQWTGAPRPGGDREESRPLQDQRRADPEAGHRGPALR